MASGEDAAQDDRAPGGRCGALALELIAGGAIGLLVGLLTGLSASPVVGSVLAGILSLLGALFGLVPLEGVGLRLPRRSATRVAAFGLAAAGAVLLGLFIRANDVLTIDPDPDDVARRIAAYEKAGLAPSDARAIVMVKAFGLQPAGAGQDGTASLQPPRQSVLFGGETPERCGRIDRIAEDNLAERLALLNGFGGDWAELAARVETKPEAEQAAALRATLAVLCDE